MGRQVNDVGGIIAIDRHGNFGKAFNTPIMGWASIREDKLESGSKKNEVMVEQL